MRWTRAKAGQEVVEGETLVILEALKMEMSIAAPVTRMVHSIPRWGRLRLRGAEGIVTK
jgi:acetyl/propionyl-CoA carboxylase alpha subunit